MNLMTARAFLVTHRQDYNRDRLPWLPQALYRSLREARPRIIEPLFSSWGR